MILQVDIFISVDMRRHSKRIIKKNHPMYNFLKKARTETHKHSHTHTQTHTYARAHARDAVEKVKLQS